MPPPDPPADPCVDPALARFLAGDGEAAFAELVAAHGPMVLAVCRRVLRNPADAEDAFQATFLALAQSADKVAELRTPVGGWLYGTAYRVSLLARRTAVRRAVRESRRPTPMPTTPDPNELAARGEAERLVDDELHRLPGRLRQPLVLCYVAGLTHDQAAEQLDIHPRTLERRLRAGLDALRARLGRRGVVASAAVLVAILSPAASAAVPPPLAAAAARTAVEPAAPAVAALVRPAPSVWLAACAGGLAAAGLIGGGAAWQAAGPGPAAPGPAVVAVAPAAVAVAPAAVPPPDPAPAAAPPAPVTFVPEHTGGQMRPIQVSGRLLDDADGPIPGVTVLFLCRPVRRAADGSLEAVPDPTPTVQTKRGRFRVLARGVTDAAGRFVLRGERAIPDPATGAQLLQMYPLAVGQTGGKLTDVVTDFEAVQMMSGDGG